LCELVYDTYIDEALKVYVTGSGRLAGNQNRGDRPAKESVWSYCSFAYSALACVSTGISGSAPFHRVRNSL